MVMGSVCGGGHVRGWFRLTRRVWRRWPKFVKQWLHPAQLQACCSCDSEASCEACRDPKPIARPCPDGKVIPEAGRGVPVSSLPASVVVVCRALRLGVGSEALCRAVYGHAIHTWRAVRGRVSRHAASEQPARPRGAHGV